MRKFDYDVARAVINLTRSGDTNFDTFVKYLKTCIYTTEQQGYVEESETRLRWLQGQIQMLRHIIEEINKAEETIKKLKNLEQFKQSERDE